MTEANKRKASERMKAYHANKSKPEETVAELKARIAELEAKQESLPPPAESVEEQIKRAYQTGQSSIQTIARVYNVPVSTVLVLIGEGESASIEYPGDFIDSSEAGQDATMNYGSKVKIPYSVD